MAQTKEKIEEIIKLLKKMHSKATCELHYSNQLELLVAVILSAQCTDARVNKVIPALFRKYKTPEDYANADQKELEKYIHSTGFYRNKAKNIMAACKLLVEKFHSKVPKTMEELLELPGVARKTANIVLAKGHGLVVGIPVDTHVKRLSQRLHLTKNNDPNKIEQDLMSLVPRNKWEVFTDTMVFHGRYICYARKPKCNECLINKICPSAFKV